MSRADRVQEGRESVTAVVATEFARTRPDPVAVFVRRGR
jgi:hypothetical protein